MSFLYKSFIFIKIYSAYIALYSAIYAFSHSKLLRKSKRILPSGAEQPAARGRPRIKTCLPPSDIKAGDARVAGRQLKAPAHACAGAVPLKAPAHAPVTLSESGAHARRCSATESGAHARRCSVPQRIRRARAPVLRPSAAWPSTRGHRRGASRPHQTPPSCLTPPHTTPKCTLVCTHA